MGSETCHGVAPNPEMEAVELTRPEQNGETSSRAVEILQPPQTGFYRRKGAENVTGMDTR